MHRKILSNEQETLLAVERHWLTNLQLALAQFEASQEDRAALEHSIRQLDELFLLVIVGEFNAGKSAFINALMGEPFLEEGVTPTTTRIHLLKHGRDFERVAIESSVDVYTAPAEWLKEINIVDTPGTNAIYREHETITQEFIPRSDLVLFVTSVDRPFTESERSFMEVIKGWGKKVVIVLNKVDILEDAEDVARIKRFVEENAQKLLEFTPEIFAVSARQALKAKQTGDEELLEKSNFNDLEEYVISTLDEVERIRLKLLNPIGVGTHLVKKYVDVIDERLALLQEDFEVMENVERQLDTYREDMQREFRYRLSDVENVLHEFENRGMNYFDETMRLVRLPDLLNKSKLEKEYEEQVVADVPHVVEERTSDLIDWLIASNLHQWQSVMDHIATRKEKHADRIVGHVGGTFEYDRARLLDTVGRMVQQTLENYDPDAESRRIATSLQRAVANTAIVEVSAIGLGALITAIATTTAADLTGIFAAGTMAVLGLLVIPAKRRKVKQELRERIAEVREQLMATLTNQFDRALRRSINAIDVAISPYTRFIRSERQHLTETRSELTNIRDWLERQAAEISEL